MMVLLVILPLPVLAAVLFFVLSKNVCWREFGTVLASVLLIGALSVGLSFCGATRDTEIWNGTVEGKEKDRVSCRHSYDCHCRNVQSCTGSGSSRHCTTRRQCDTCYEHSNDWDWLVHTTVGEFEINRIDRQGKEEPPRWTAVLVGEPASKAHDYTNYIKAAPDTVLRMTNQAQDFPGLMPAYPQPYDYYRVRHIVPVGVAVPNLDEMEESLSRTNGVMGPARQVNILYVIVKTGDRRYQQALEEHWLGGKKNDLVVIIGVPDGRDKIEWAAVMSWSNVELLKVMLRDDIEKIGTISKLPDIISRTSALVAKHFVRKPMADFAYLRYQYSPSPGLVAFLIVIGLIVSIGLCIYFVQNDPFDSGFRPRGGGYDGRLGRNIHRPR